MKSAKNNTVVILVDMQEFFLQNLQKNVRKELTYNQIKVLDFCKKNKISVIVTQYDCRGVFRGKLIPILNGKVAGNLAGTTIKHHNSGFTKTSLDDLLKELRVKKLLIMGVNANACVQDTAIGALHRGYSVISSKGIIASAGRNDLELSKKNETWFKKNIKLFENIDELQDSLK